MRKALIPLTLASNGSEIIVSADCIAFAAAMEGEEKKFTRIYFKELVMDDESRWVDVKETPGEIRRRI